MKEEINRLLENTISGFVDLLPRLLLAVAVVLIGLLLALLTEKLIKQFILYLDRNINKNLQQKFLHVDLRGSALFISKTIFWIILIFSVFLFTQISGLDFLATWFSKLVDFLPKILAVVIIVFTGVISGRLVGDLIASAASRSGLTNGKYIGRIIRYLILFITIIIAIGQIGIDIMFLSNLVIIVVAALLFGAALAFGLGARTSVSNILGSYYVRKTYREGNTIQIGEIVGVIVKITDNAVCLETKSGQVSIPAKNFGEETTILIKKN